MIPPIIQAPMAGVTTPELVAAVSNAGGLGSLGAALLSPDEIRKAIQDIRALTSLPFNVNLFSPMPEEKPGNMNEYIKLLSNYQKEMKFSINPPTLPSWGFNQQIEILLEEKVPIFSFTFGIPPLDIIQKCKDASTIVIGTATNVQEAIELESAGVEFIVCQGKEAGGHRGTFRGALKESLIPTFELLGLIRSHVNLPLIASGGIMNAEDITDALQKGATAVQMGTVFLTTDESGASSMHKKALLEWKTHPTILTRAHSGKWARCIANRFACDLAPFDLDVPPYPLPRFLTKPLKEASNNSPDFGSFWAGERFALCCDTSAEVLMKKLSEGCSQ